MSPGLTPTKPQLPRAELQLPQAEFRLPRTESGSPIELRLGPLSPGPGSTLR